MAIVKKYWVWVFIILLACLLSILYLVFWTPKIPEPKSPTQSAPVSTPVPTETSPKPVDQGEPTQATRPSAVLTISRIQSAASVSLYDRFEVRFAINGMVAKNLQWPYDPGPVTGMADETLRTGITVDGLFLPPGQTDWEQALVQPAFLYQPVLIDRNTTAGTPNSEWIYPVGKAYWLLRFAPTQTGNWQFKIRAQDDLNYPAWSESSVRHFSVTEAQPGNHGFVQVSSRDGRYFEYSDGAPYTGMGVNAADRGIYHAEQQAEMEFRQRYAVGKINLARTWMDMDLIFSRGTHGWDAWRTRENTSDDLRTTEQVYQDHDFSVKLGGSAPYIFQASNGNQLMAGGLEAGITYLVRVTAYLGSTPAEALVVRLVSNPEDFNAILQELGPNGNWVVTDLGDGWKRFESSFTNTHGRLLFKSATALAIGVTSGTAYLDELYIGEDLGDGEGGPNVVFRGEMNYHQSFDPIASANWDLIFTHAEKYGLALKVVISDKQDFILNRIRLADGVFDPSIGLNADNFHSQRGYKVRRLQEYYWRYLAARWGHSRGVHSWELLNEGDPGSPAHRDQAVHLAQVMQIVDCNHLATTSFWTGFPASFWTEAGSVGVGYADVHAYLSTGLRIYPGITDDRALLSDSAAYHIAYSHATREQLTAAGGNMPIIRGEAGIDVFEEQREQDALANDPYGVWLHNFLWATLHPGGLYELYWWSGNLRNQPGPDGDTADGLFEIYAPYYDFMADIPINAGGYVGIGVDDPLDLLIVGQQNNGGSQSDLAHLWIRAEDYTWKNVVDGMRPDDLAGTVILKGMAPETAFPVEWWDFNARGELRIRDETLWSDATGQLRLDLSISPISSLPVTDTAVKIGMYAP